MYVIFIEYYRLVFFKKCLALTHLIDFLKKILLQFIKGLVDN